MAEKNTSFVLEKAGQVQYEDRPVPELKHDTDVLVNIKQTGICGSDVHYWVSGAIGDFVVRAPMVLGHESSGIVSAVGAGVTSLAPGDRVCLEPGIPCRVCTFCKSGRYNLCPDYAFAATPPYDGTLAKYYVLPHDMCFQLPAHVSLEEGALIEPLAVAVHIVKRADVRPGQSVVVFGAGPVGLLCAGVARAFGAAKIISVDINEERLAFARKFAATGTFAPSKTPAAESAKRLIDEQELGVGADVAIEASGAEPSVQTAVHVLRSGGTYVQGGMGKPDVSFPVTAMTTKELVVRGSFRYAEGDYPLAVQMVADGKVRVKELITKMVPFDKAEEAFSDVKAGKGIKILIGGVA
ncbi:MAG: hypothetical protein M1838_000281 [Thelocarpon superellum]|nr:MAG: hypothetical protein M1838_000281 [Thelocarpon superellum]